MLYIVTDAPLYCFYKNIAILLTEGPYLISCNDGLAFLKVVQDSHGQASVLATNVVQDSHRQASVLATQKIEQASQFYRGVSRD